MTQDANISVRIPREIKERMKEIDVDWADYLRAAIEIKLKEAKRKEASRSIDTIRNKTKHGTFDSVKAIRADRDI